ncbi:serine hydrolase [Saccharomonospora sp. CUA-673]|uniref:serine hydrolase n=1 Tax=Saccharomonospora sp. CUA-673 TaxID=1904969 RepID=UPI0009FA25AB|nr:serine hydrolase [Saccharomonospora sp. CUA-673]
MSGAARPRGRWQAGRVQDHHWTRRGVLLAAAAAGLAACTTDDDAEPPPQGAGVPSRLPEGPDITGQLHAVETRFGGRLGVYAVDTGNGFAVRYRERERFLMASTAKLPIVAATLGRGVPLDQPVPIRQEDVLEYAPVVAERVGQTMTVAELCDAAITQSDNSAANLLTAQVGGPEHVTGFLRETGDRVTRLDRWEPELNTRSTSLDTTTPAAMGDCTRTLLFDGASMRRPNGTWRTGSRATPPVTSASRPDCHPTG